MVQVDRSKLPEPGDTTIECMECRTPFVFKVGEQQYFREHDLTTPKRCPECRRVRREERERAQREDS